MIEWLTDHTLTFSITCVTAVIISKTLIGKLSATVVYRLFIIIPLALLVAHIPSPVRKPQILDISAVDYLSSAVSVPSASNLEIALPVLWLIGAAAALVYILLNLLAASRILQTASLGQPINGRAVSYSRRTNSPAVYGIFNGRIVLPVDAETFYSESELAIIVEHEYVHIKRRDNLLTLLAISIASIFWFNPLSWLAFKQFRLAQEASCDERVLRDKSISRKRYAQAMLKSLMSSPTHQYLFAHSGEKKMLLSRLKLIKNNMKPAKHATLFAFFTLFFVSACAVESNTTLETTELEPTPIVLVHPLYPRQLMTEGVEGEVIVEFLITENFTVDDVTVVSSESSDGTESSRALLETAALNAIQKFKYSPEYSGLTSHYKFSFKTEG